MAITARGLVQRLEIWSTWKAAGGTIETAIPDFIDCKAQVALGQDRLTVSFPISSAAAAYATARKIIRVVQSDTVFDEWRIVGRNTDRQQGIVVISATSIRSTELAEGALIFRQDSDGVKVYDFESVGLTPAEHIDSWILPALTAAGFTWISVGTITPTAPVDMVFSWDSPLSALLRLAGTDYEVDFRRNGTTGYLIDVVARVNSSAVQADIRFDKNMVNVVRDEDTVDMATRVFPRGAEDGDGNHATMGRAEWKVAVVSGTSICIEDPSGGPDPILYDDQLNDTYLRKVDGTLVHVTDTDYATQTVVVTSATGITAGDLVQFRADSSGNDLTSLTNPVTVQSSSYGEKVRVKDLPDISGTKNVVANPFVRTWSSALPDGWASVGAPTLSKQTVAPYAGSTGQSIKVEATVDGQGVISPSGIVFPTDANPFGSGFARFWVAAGQVRVELVITTGTGTVVFPLPSEGVASSTLKGQFEDLGPTGADLNKLGATSVAVRVVQNGPTAATFYVAAAQATQTSSQEPLIEGSGGTQLWQAANELLRTNSLPVIGYSVPLLDLEAINDALWAESALVIGGPVRIRDDVLNIDVVSRILEVDRDYVDPGKTAITISNKPDDITDLLAAKPTPRRKFLPAPPKFTPIPTVPFPPVGPAGVLGIIFDWFADKMVERGHVSGEALSTIYDESGFGFDLFQSGALKIVLEENALNGHAVFDMTGNKAATTAVPVLTPTNGCTVFTIIKRTGSHVEHGIWWSWGTIEAGLHLTESHHVGVTADVDNMLDISSGGGGVGFIQELDTEWVIVAIRITDPGLAEAFVRGAKIPLYDGAGTLIGTSLDPGPDGDAPRYFTLGNGVVGGGNGLNGKSPRTWGYSRAITDDEIISIVKDQEVYFFGSSTVGMTVPSGPIGDPILPFDAGAAVAAGTITTSGGYTWLALKPSTGVTPVEGEFWTKLGLITPGIPSGGTSGYVLAKASGSDYDVAWIAPGAGGGGIGTILGIAQSDTHVTVNPDPSSDTLIDSMTVTFTLTATARVRMTAYVRFGKSGGGVRGSFYNGATNISTVDVHSGGSTYNGWYSTQGNSNENGNNELVMSQLVLLAAGTYTISVKEQAAGNTNRLELGERYLLCDVVALS